MNQSATTPVNTQMKSNTLFTWIIRASDGTAHLTQPAKSFECVRKRARNLATCLAASGLYDSSKIDELVVLIKQTGRERIRIENELLKRARKEKPPGVVDVTTMFLPKRTYAITQKQAIEMKHTQYVDGKTCKRGHTAPKRTGNRYCTVCHLENSAAYYRRKAK